MKYLLWAIDPIESTRRYRGAEERLGAALSWARALSCRDAGLVEVTDDAGNHVDVVTPRAARAAKERSA